MRQVQLPGFLAWRTPGHLQLSVRGEAMHPAVAIAVGHIDIAIGVGHHFGGVVERRAGTLHQPILCHDTGIGVHAAPTELHQRLPFEGERNANGIGTIGGVADVIYYLEAMRLLHRTSAPSAEVIALAVKDDDRRILALKHIHAILRVGRDPTHDAERLSGRHLGPIGNSFVSVITATRCCHVVLLSPAKRPHALKADSLTRCGCARIMPPKSTQHVKHCGPSTRHHSADPPWDSSAERRPKP